MSELVRDLMTRSVAVIPRSSDLRDLEKLMLREGVHGVPVVDEVGRLVGVVSQSDVLAWHASTDLEGVPFYDRPDDRPLERQGGPPRGTGDRTALVAEIMSPLVHCIGPDKTVAEAAARMVREHIHRLIVVDEAYAVVGVVSATDLLRSVPGVQPLLSRQVC